MIETLTLLGYVINKYSNKITVRSRLVPGYQKVYSEDGHILGKVVKIYGPASQPYIDITITGKMINDKVYIEGGKDGGKKKR